MIEMPNPWLSDSEPSPPRSEQAAPPIVTPPRRAGAKKAATKEDIRGAPGGRAHEPHEAAGAADDISDVHEIFHWARLLCHGGIPLDQLVRRGFDVAEFMRDLDEAPLFLRVPIKEMRA